MISGSILLMVQFLCFALCIILALMLGMSRIYQQSTYVGYETSRMMLIFGLILLAVHFYLQMHYGFRARSEEVGALVNILFFSPFIFLFVFSTIRLSCGRQYLKKYLIVSGVGMAAIIVCFLLGWKYYDSLEMPVALKAMGIVFFLCIDVIIVMTWKEIDRVRTIVEEETASDLRNYDLYMRTGTTILYGTGLLISIGIFSSVAIAYFIAPIFLLAMIFYIVSFMALGFNISAVGEVLDEATMELDAEENVEESKEGTAQSGLSPSQLEEITAAIAEWRNQRGYGVMSLTSSTLASRIGISKKLLSQYLTEHEGKTFRVWLSDIRIEEVKRMLLDKTEYSNEAIASECGFSSRSWMQEKFKADTGLTPNEWRAAQVKN